MLNTVWSIDKPYRRAVWLAPDATSAPILAGLGSPIEAMMLPMNPTKGRNNISAQTTPKTLNTV